MSPRPDLGPKPHLGYTQSLIDRAAERRLDRAWLAASLKDPRTRTYVIGVEMIVMKKGGAGHDPAFTPDEARALAPATETCSSACTTAPRASAPASRRPTPRS